ncbi:MAG: uroporphyrinogen-III synthase, partial [Bacteroidales bacterium]|nr:uroporphyrinogen-III synthase [Bacteroidales bacterium]
MKTLYTGAICPNPEYLHTPLIEIVALEDNSQLKSAVERLQEFDYLLFTSRFAVKYWAEAGGGFNALAQRGGHIGYGVRYSEWNRGYGTKM